MTAFVLSPEETDLRKIVFHHNETTRGRSNATGSFSLTANAGTTAVSAMNCASGSQVFLFPKTAHAAAELAAGGCYVSTVANQSFTVTHANNAQADRTFGYVCLG